MQQSSDRRFFRPKGGHRAKSSSAASAEHALDELGCRGALALIGRHSAKPRLHISQYPLCPDLWARTNVCVEFSEEGCWSKGGASERKGIGMR
eukprot:705639-Alexandrium_andersonii.AAC.1